jgi:hypothetical protein
MSILYVDVFTHSQLKSVFSGKFPDVGFAFKTLHSLLGGVVTSIFCSQDAAVKPSA